MRLLRRPDNKEGQQSKGGRVSSNYQDLVAKVDAKFAEIRESTASAMTCHLGCHGCCKAGLTVSRVEKEAIGSALLANESILELVKQVKNERPHGFKRCSFLSAQGQCTIYAFRPLICRSHGAPIRMRQGPRLSKDVCPLNFRGQSLDDLLESQFVNLELLNTILALINEQAYGADGRKRYAMELDAILGDA